MKFSDFKRALNNSPSEALLLAILVLLGMSLRWIAWLRSGIMFNDGPEFIRLAQAAAEYDWVGLFSHDYHPLYSVLIAFAHSLLDSSVSWANTAVAISVLSSGICILALYAFLRFEFGITAALFGVLLFVTQQRSIDYFSDVMSEGVYATFFVGALFCLSRSLSTSKKRWFFGVGVISGLAYLVRPEGLGPVAILGTLITWEFIRRRVTGRVFFPRVGILVGSALLVASPYVFSVWKVTGEIVLTQKKPVLEIIGVNPLLRSLDLPAKEPRRKGVGSFGADISFLPLDESEVFVEVDLKNSVSTDLKSKTMLSRIFDSFGELFDALISTAKLEWCLPIFLGLWFSRGSPGRRGGWIGFTTSAYFLLLIGLALHTEYLSKRHVFPIILPFLGYAGVGLAESVRLLKGRLGLSLNACRMAVLIPLLVVSLSSQFEPRRNDRMAIRNAAEWFSQSYPSKIPIAAEKQRVAFYANTYFVAVGCAKCPIGPNRDEAALTRARTSGAKFLISDKEEWNLLAKSLRIPVLYEVEKNKKIARVYDLRGLP